MTTKLPEVGKRYKPSYSPCSPEIEFEIISIGEDESILLRTCGSEKETKWSKRKFEINFEELPDQPTEKNNSQKQKEMLVETTATNETVNLKKEGEVQISEVDKALEELKEVFGVIECYNNRMTFADDLYEKAQSLVTALEAEKACDKCGQFKPNTNLNKVDHDCRNPLKWEGLSNMSKPKPKIDIKKQSVDSITASSYYKHRHPYSGDPVSEDEFFRASPSDCIGEDESGPKIDMKEGGGDSVKSIWKPVSELPRVIDNVLVKFDDSSTELAMLFNLNGEMLISSGATLPKDRWNYEINLIKSACTLTDYINNIEERLSKLESNNK
jgi:hypothetical protein